jgi:hypothetical protein
MLFPGCGPGSPAIFTWTTSHYFILALEAIFNLATLARNDTSAAPMSDMFRDGFPRMLMCVSWTSFRQKY